MPVLGKCPKCQKDFHLHLSVNGVGGVYEVFIHKRADGMGHLRVEVGRCSVSRNGDPELINNPKAGSDFGPLFGGR